MVSNMDFSPLFISMKVALLATFVTFFLGILAAKLVVSMKRGRNILDSLFSLPMVLPPTVVGFFLLLVFGSNGVVGKVLAGLGASVVFQWQGAVIAATVVSFPIMYRTTRGALEQVDKNLIYAARTLGLGEWTIIIKVILPNCWPGIGAATILAFARAIGEFGATIMLAGNIPGKTQTMAVAIYTAVQGGNRQLAYQWVLVIMAISISTILLMNYWLEYQKREVIV